MIWYEKAAKNGNTNGMNILAKYYENGMIGTPNLSKAAAWYYRAAKKEDSKGMQNLARCYQYGIGLRKNHAKAFKLFFYSTFVARLIFPFNMGNTFLDICTFFGALIVVYTATGIMESVMGRLRMDKVPKFVLTSFALAFFAVVITLEFVK